jgi:hypothetical protein
MATTAWGPKPLPFHVRLADPGSAAAFDGRLGRIVRSVVAALDTSVSAADAGDPRTEMLGAGAALLRTRAAAAHFGYRCELRGRVHERGLPAQVELVEGQADHALAVLYRIAMQARIPTACLSTTSRQDGYAPAQRAPACADRSFEGDVLPYQDGCRLLGLARACGVELFCGPRAPRAAQLLEIWGAAISGVVGVVTSADSSSGWLAAGEALERFRLGCAAIGLATRSCAAALRSPSLRRRLARFFGVGDPVQALVWPRRHERPLLATPLAGTGYAIH